MEATAKIEITPKMMAEAFWNMESTLQVEFFKELAAEIRADHDGGNDSAYSNGELQWFYVCKDLESKGNEAARDMLMTMASPLYMHTLMACDKW